MRVNYYMRFHLYVRFQFSVIELSLRITNQSFGSKVKQFTVIYTHILYIIFIIIKNEYFFIFVHADVLLFILIRAKYFRVPSLYVPETLSIRLNSRIHRGYDGDVTRNEFPVNLVCSNGSNSPKS